METFNDFPAGSPERSADFCAAWADAECQTTTRCNPALRAALDTAGGCAFLLTTRCAQERAGALAAENRGRAVYDSHLAASCVQATAARLCQDAEPVPCAEVFQGSVGTDGACRQDLECAPGLFCSGGPVSCGQCVPRAGVGGPCWSATSCQTNTRCVDGRCTGALELGAACAAIPALCPDGAGCVGTGFTARCMMPAGRGADCSEMPCAQGFSCVDQDGRFTCQPNAAENAACHPDGLGAPACQDQGTRLGCDPLRHVCKPVVVSSEAGPCDGESLVCRADLRCQQGTCVTRPAAGDVCNQVDECWLSRCESGTCVVPARLGDACAGTCLGLECVAGACGVDSCPDGGVPWDAGVERDAGSTDGGGR